MTTSDTFIERNDKSSLALPACLIIMDGFGLEDAGEGNAISLAATPNLDSLFKNNEWVKLRASGKDVGLPHGQMGNSEVGHLNIGAGRIVHQELSRINNACDNGEIEANPVISEAFEKVAAVGSTLHLMGLLSDGGVHSSNAHLYALLHAAVDAGIKRIRIHCFLDGRDVPPQSGKGYIEELIGIIDSITSDRDDLDLRIASLMGRYYSMDRDNRWDRVKRAYDAIVCPVSVSDKDPIEAVELSYQEGVTDEFVVPVSFEDEGLTDGDAVVFFNFRPDRAREITRAIVDADFDRFERGFHPRVEFVCLTEYDPTIDAPVAFPKQFPDNVLADVLASEGLTQLHIAETEKYAHVTFFLNGGIEKKKPGEKRMLIASPKVATYDLQPEMSEPEVSSSLVASILADEADVYIVNFANCDMVGHTGSIPAAIKAVEAVDSGVGAVVDAIRSKGGIALVTADHGNADSMLADDGTPHTAHTTAPVPLILVDASGKDLHLSGADGKLADIAPTLLRAIGLDVPEQMSGNNLLAS